MSEEVLIEEQIRERAQGEGFDVVRFAKPEIPARNREGYARFVEEGFAGDMAWLAREPERRRDPLALWAEVRSVIVLAASYAPEDDPLPDLERREQGVIALYARRRDYHDELKK
ncbi:MAG: QueG-associated DUF1730 domain-containing protein, partial [Geminicoccaceae bacterium]|nr:QueG-associated DUF1730 domain-containing protein [Geminicoccaceae bacterium]